MHSINNSLQTLLNFNWLFALHVKHVAGVRYLDFRPVNCELALLLKSIKNALFSYKPLSDQ